jgi:hypothetical protein
MGYTYTELTKGNGDRSYTGDVENSIEVFHSLVKDDLYSQSLE